MSSDSEEEPNTPGEQSEKNVESDTSDEGVQDPFVGGTKRLTEEDITEGDTFGFRVISSMNESDLDTLLIKLEAQCSLQDTVTINIRMKRLNWELIAFEPYSADECRAAWFYLKSHTRKFRIMAEVLQEIKLSAGKDKTKFRSRIIEAAPGFPKKPPTAPAYLFCKELWKANPEKQNSNFLIFQRECLEGFQRLDEKKQDDWQLKLDLAVTEYQKEVKEFYAKYPNYDLPILSTTISRPRSRARNGVAAARKKRGESAPSTRSVIPPPKKIDAYPDAPEPPLNPQGEFVHYKLSELENTPDSSELTELKTKYSNKWHKFSNRLKNTWIDHVVRKLDEYLLKVEDYKKSHPGYTCRPIRLRNHVSKADLEIWTYFDDQPEKPPRNVFEMFYLEKLQTPEYTAFPADEARKKATEEFKLMDSDDKELAKINFRRSVLQYKKNIERYFDHIPDFLKPHILLMIPKKLRPGLASNVDKLSEAILLEEEELEKVQENTQKHEEDPETDPLNESSPPAKKKKIKGNLSEEEYILPVLVKSDPALLKKDKKKHRKNEEEDPNEIIEYVDVDKLINGQSEDIVPTRKTKRKISCQQMPKLETFTEERMATRRDIDEIIRGILDARPHVGRYYSVFYFYAKYASREKIWTTKVNIYGLHKTAEKMYETFVGLSNHQKRLFITQSWEWHKESDFAIRPREKFVPGEPLPPPRNAKLLYNDDMKIVAQGHINMVIPRWSELEEEIQMLYMKRLYRDTRKYAKDYEDFIMKLSPQDMALYTLFQSKKWEDLNLGRDTLRSSWRGFIFPFAKDTHNEDDIGGDSEPEILDSDTLKAHGQKRRLNCRQPSVLDNEDLILEITNNVTKEEPTVEELMTDTSSSSNDEGDG